MILGMNHFTVIAEDPQATMDFYTGLLGLKPGFRPDLGFPGAWLYGEDPKQGFVENNMFYHPVLKFQFPVPRNWQTQNSPSQFQMSPKDGNAVMIFTLAQGNSLEEAAQATLQGMGLQATENQKTTINGNPALVVVSRQAPPEQQQGQQGGQDQQQQKQSLLIC